MEDIKWTKVKYAQILCENIYEFSDFLNQLPNFIKTIKDENPTMTEQKVIQQISDYANARKILRLTNDQIEELRETGCYYKIKDYFDHICTMLGTDKKENKMKAQIMTQLLFQEKYQALFQRYEPLLMAFSEGFFCKDSFADFWQNNMEDNLEPSLLIRYLLQNKNDKSIIRTRCAYLKDLNFQEIGFVDDDLQDSMYTYNRGDGQIVQYENMKVIPESRPSKDSITYSTGKKGSFYAISINYQDRHNGRILLNNLTFPLASLRLKKFNYLVRQLHLKADNAKLPEEQPRRYTK